MKKFLVNIILVLFLSGNAYAGCVADLDAKFEWVGFTDKKEDLLFIFKNKCFRILAQLLKLIFSESDLK